MCVSSLPRRARTRECLFAAILLALAPFATRGAEQPPRNLFQVEAGILERSSVPELSRDDLRPLGDGAASTVVTIPTPPGQPVELVFGFQEDTVTPEQLVVQLPAEIDPETAPREIEIFVSTLSPHAAFQSLRVDRLQASSEPQSFRFRPTGARWILLRITPPTDASTVVLAELAVMGRTGPPETHYAFKDSPADALQVLKKLQESVRIDISDAEISLLEDAADGRLEHISFGEAALLASGVADSTRRKRYVEQIDALAREVERSHVDGETSFERGEQLLRWLHEDVLTEGYREQQTLVSALLDEGSYNCVSSATIYNILGRRLDLDLRAIEVPDHAFSILYDGTRHADVETTTAEGFNPARNPQVLRELEEKKGLRYIPDRNRDKRREIGETGLIAIIYYNRGVELTRQKRYPEALSAYFRALSLDREFASAVKNVMAVLTNWSKELSDAGDYQRAVDVLQVGIELAPEDATLLHNRKVAWTHWAESLADAEKPAEALEILQQAYATTEDESFVAQRAWVFIRPAEALIEDGRWDDALAAATNGLQKLDGEARRELLSWRNGLFLRWSSAELKARRFQRAEDILARGLATDADEKRFVNNLAYLAQEWSRAVYQEKGQEPAAEVLEGMIKRHTGAKEPIQGVARNFVRHIVGRLRDAKQYETALKVVDDRRELLSSEEERARLQRNIYDAWAQALMDERDWEKALKIYDQALDKLPGDNHLQHNAEVVWDRRARGHVQAEQWDEALTVYKQAVERYPKVNRFRTNLRYVAVQSLQSLGDQQGQEVAEKHLGEWLDEKEEFPEFVEAAQSYFEQTVLALMNEEDADEAFEALDRGMELVGKKKLIKAARLACDHRAGELRKAEKWSEAIEVYREGMERYPGDSHLGRNAVFTWNAWASAHIDAKDWDSAIDLYEQALEDFPDNSTLKNNLRYCRQQNER